MFVRKSKDGILSLIIIFMGINEVTNYLKVLHTSDFLKFQSDLTGRGHKLTNWHIEVFNTFK